MSEHGVRANHEQSAAPLLVVDGLVVAYGRTTVLDGVDLEVRAGEIVALLGTNGAGKSTLLKAVSGVIPLRGGRVTFAGRDLTGARSDRIVAAGVVQMPGGRATFPGLTVEENLRVGAVAVAPALRPDRVGEALSRFPALADRRDHAAGTLSGGLQQQLALARAVMTHPRLLMIDELSLGLAPSVVRDLLVVIEDLRGSGTSVLLVEQQVDLALDVADRAYFLERGAVRFEGPAEELRGRTDLLRAVFLTG